MRMPSIQPARIDPSLLHACILGMSLLVFPLDSFTQHTLPKPAVLAEQQVKAIHVTKTALRLEDRDGNDVTDDTFEPTSVLQASYFLNERGTADSIYILPAASDPFRKDVLGYDDQGRLVEHRVYHGEGQLNSRILVEFGPDKMWHARTWQGGVLMLEIKSTADSITLESITHRQHSPEHNYYTYSYNLEEDIRTETSYQDGVEMYSETAQWIAVEGAPKRFIHETYTRGDLDKWPETETLEFELDEDGNVVNDLMGLVFDPYHMDNYFERHRKFKGITSPVEGISREDSLVTEKEIAELLTFDGTSVVYRYEFTYE